jgi:hypothetical protein
MPRFVALLVLLAALPLFPASAQTGLDRRGETVRVQVNISFFVAGPTDEGEESTKVRERARRIVYAMAGSECAVLQQTMARDCRLETLNVNVNIRHGQQQPEGFMVNGGAAYRIVLKQ